MLVFIDESGDTGFKFDIGSSSFFTIVLVVFEDRNEALACDKKIASLRPEVGWKDGDEFHFKSNSDKIRKKFFKAIESYNFFYYGIVINKKLGNALGINFKNKEYFYKYVCGLIFENAKDKLMNAVVIIDKSGGTEFRNKLSVYLRKKINKTERIIKEVKMQKSNSNNLLQLADYVAGALNKSIQDQKSEADVYRNLISHREISVNIWPKKKIPTLSFAGKRQ